MRKWKRRCGLLILLPYPWSVPSRGDKGWAKQSTGGHRNSWLEESVKKEGRNQASGYWEAKENSTHHGSRGSFNSSCRWWLVAQKEHPKISGDYSHPCSDNSYHVVGWMTESCLCMILSLNLGKYPMNGFGRTRFLVFALYIGNYLPFEDQSSLLYLGKWPSVLGQKDLPLFEIQWNGAFQT